MRRQNFSKQLRYREAAIEKNNLYWVLPVRLAPDFDQEEGFET